MKHYYKIGEISKLYNIGTDSLRYYEELGILKPARGKNGYRMYHIHDLWRLNVVRDLRELGFSMERIKEYLNNRSLTSTETLLEEELEVICEKMTALKRLQSNIEERLDTIRDAMQRPLRLIERRELPDRYCHVIHKGYQEDMEMDMLIKQLVNMDKEKLYIIGNNRIGSMIPYESILAGEYRHYTEVFIIDKNGSYLLEGGSYLSVSYGGDSSQNGELIPQLLQYALGHGLEPCGPVLELLWSDIHQSEEQREHITELQIRCREV